MITAAQVAKIAVILAIPRNVSKAAADYIAVRRDDSGRRMTMWQLCCIHGVKDAGAVQEAVYNIENNMHLIGS